MTDHTKSKLADFQQVGQIWLNSIKHFISFHGSCLTRLDLRTWPKPCRCQWNSWTHTTTSTLHPVLLCLYPGIFSRCSIISFLCGIHWRANMTMLSPFLQYVYV